ncbi:MAG: methionyl-tRNA formyltransferase [Candidatus Hydrogenedentes bacterium]|nr:methionyl-tRNA formyltransferase [Candidatus Hydrogenedentota bacterium]
MRIVFFGTPGLAVPSLEGVAAAHQVSAVVCQPDKPQGRSKRPVPPATKVWAEEEQGIEVSQPAKLNDGVFEAWLRGQAPEVCVLAAYGRILKQAILDVPRYGFLNVHASLLPRHRGPSPIQTAILEGDGETGVTIMRLDAGTDTGDMLLHKAIPIDSGDTTESLAKKLAELGAELILEALNLVESGAALYEKQDESLATHTKIYKKEDGRVRWNMRARGIHNLVRAFVPWPVAYCRFQGDTVRIHKTRVVETGEDRPPGTVLLVREDDIVVAAGEGALAIEMIQASGKKAMPMADFLRGNTIEAGDLFEDV